MAYPVLKARLRYIVPIYFEDDFTTIVEQIDKVRVEEENCRKWIRLTADNLTKQSELYEHVKNETLFNQATENILVDDAKIGCQWIHYNGNYSNECTKKGVFKFLYYKNGLDPTMTELPKALPLKIANMGIIIYRNNVGFVWYELVLDNRDKINSDELVMLQEHLKKLNVNQGCWFWSEKKVVREPIEYGITYKLATGDGQELEVYLQPINFGEWLAKELEDIKIDYMLKQSSSFNVCLQKCFEVVKNISEINIVVSDKEKEKHNVKVPARAILYNYVLFDSQELSVDNLEMAHLAYHLGNGYNMNHHFNDVNITNMSFPFKEVVWYGSKEGVAFLSWPSKENIEVFKSGMFERAKSDYFTIFIKVLYQSVSLMQYSKQIAKKINLGVDNFLKNDVITLYTSINVFLVKNIETSVSNINHQSEFYLYLMRSLKIQEEIKSVTVGLEALSVLKREKDKHEAEEQEKKRDNKIQAGVGAFALLGVFSAFVDGFDFIAKFVPGGEWERLSATTKNVELSAFSFITGVACCSAYFMFIAIKEAFFDKE